MTKQILRTSDEAAKRVTVTGWVSSTGHFFGDDERAARYAGCTHLVCDCGELYQRNAYCQKCRNKARRERFENMPTKEWDGEEPLVIFDTDDYFFTKAGLFCWLEDHELDPKNVEFCVCVPQYAHEIPDDLYCDLFPEDAYLEDCAPELAERIHQLNKYILEEKFILSWVQGKEKVIVTWDNFRQEK